MHVTCGKVPQCLTHPARLSMIPHSLTACWTINAFSFQKYNYTNWYPIGWFPKQWCQKSSILHFSSLPFALSLPQGPSCFPWVKYFASILPSPSLTFLFLCSLLPVNNILWIFIHSFGMLMRLSCFLPCPNLWDFSDTDPGISLTRESTWKPCTSLYSRTLLNCLLLNIAEDARGSHWLLKHTKPINLHAKTNTHKQMKINLKWN